MDILMLILLLAAIVILLGLLVRINGLDRKVSLIQKSLRPTSQDEKPPPPPPPPKPPDQP